MDIFELCRLIELPPEILDDVVLAAENMDLNKYNEKFKEFREFRLMERAAKDIEQDLGEDPRHIKMLTIMLKATADAYDFYKELGIDDEIYLETMKCFTRFLYEIHELTGEWRFDSYCWTVREIGGHLFRIGELEYEIEQRQAGPVIKLHIPSNCDFSPEALDRSLEKSREFFKTVLPQYADCEYHCASWLMDNQLQSMLKETSNIVAFQKRFEIINEGVPQVRYIERAFRVRTTDYESLPENTSLQRNLKKHILSGGVIRSSYGIMKK